MKEKVATPGLWNVGTSRTRHPKYLYIPDGQWPTANDIQSQRLDFYVIEAEIFEMVLKIKASQTLRRLSAQTNKEYGESWTQEECRIADYVCIAYKQTKNQSLLAIKTCIEKETGQLIEATLLQRVIQKMDNTHEKLLKVELPCLSDEEYNRLRPNKRPNIPASKKPKEATKKKKPS